MKHQAAYVVEGSMVVDCGVTVSDEIRERMRRDEERQRKIYQEGSRKRAQERGLEEVGGHLCDRVTGERLCGSERGADRSIGKICCKRCLGLLDAMRQQEQQECTCYEPKPVGADMPDAWCEADHGEQSR